MWNVSFKLTLHGCVVSVCCVGFASLDGFCDNFMIVPECWSVAALLWCYLMYVVPPLCFVSVLRGSVCCYIRKKALLQCLSND